MTYLSKFSGMAASAICALAFAVCVAAATVAPNAAYAAEYSLDVSVPVEVSVDGGSAEAQDFTFVMEPAQGEEVLPAQRQVTVNGSGEAEFALHYTQVGEHHYTVCQIAGSAEGWSYDQTVYDVAVFAMWNQHSDTLFSSVVVFTPEGKAESCSFANSYVAPEALAPAQEEQASGGVKTGDALMWIALGVGAVAAAAVVAGVFAYRRARSSAE